MIFIFIDGFGIGEKDCAKNPIWASNTNNIKYILENSALFPTDVTLNIPGLPQSATGQTAIFTGENASAVLGRHLSGQPTITLKNIINKNNLFKELLKRNLKITNSNVYRDNYLNNMSELADRRQRPSVTSVMTMSAGLEFRRVEDYKKEMGVYHDITGQILRDSGYEVDLITPQQAAERLYNISRNYDFTLYEHFMTDIIGHKMDMKLAVEEILLLDSFLGKLLELIDIEKDILIITSDHGNIEDITIKTHTFNKVPTVILGNIPSKTSFKIETLTDIMPAVLNIFDSLENING